MPTGDARAEEPLAGSASQAAAARPLAFKIIDRPVVTDLRVSRSLGGRVLGPG